ncbi:MAG: LPD7 domain-containing protein [Thiomonas sp.]|uniref:Large polyvalent protein-associated domain-containing protein n=1 Tax=mine drainage metagenome TaxID=410659 RepID=E6PLR9_9ZZZZ
MRKLTVAALQAEIDHRRQRVIYRGLDGREKFTDIGPRLVMHDKSADSLEAALRIAAQKFGGTVDITGSSEFRERAARQAVRLGIEVANADLAAVVADEQAKVQQTRGIWHDPRQAPSATQRRDTPPRQNLTEQAPSQSCDTIDSADLAAESILGTSCIPRLGCS